MSYTDEKKHLLVLFGSPRKEGYTAKLLDSFLKSFEKNEKNIEIDFVDAYDEDIAPCTACGMCKNSDTCSNHDFDEIDNYIRRANGIVVATPVYNLSVPSPLKSIMDRTQRYFEARNIFDRIPCNKEPKQAVLLITAGSDDAQGVEIIKKQFAMVFSLLNTKISNTIALMKTDTILQSEFDVALEQAENVALAMQNKM